MSRGRRALLLGALAAVLGGLAASDVSRRERALTDDLGPLEPVVVTRASIPDGARLTAPRLAVRRIPSRFLAPGTFAAPGELAGARAASELPAGGFVTDSDLDRGDGAAAPGPQIRPGERVAEVVATGSPQLVQAGGRVDVLVTREDSDGQPGRTTVPLEDVEVLAAQAAPSDSGSDGAKADAAGERVSASLRVTARQAVYLAAAQSFAHEIRLLARAPGDHRHNLAGVAMG
jgi:pilus assembly protein CpaB